MGCELTYQELAAYTCGDAGASRREEIRSHAPGCEVCRRRLETLHEVDAVLRTAAPIRPPRQIMQTSLVWTAIERLPERQRRAIAMHAFGNKSYREIAGVLHLSDAVAASLVHRARGNLARAMEPLGQITVGDENAAFRSADMLAEREQP